MDIQLDRLHSTVYIVDVDRWKTFVAEIETTAFGKSTYYLHDCFETKQVFLVELGSDNNIAIVHNRQVFLAIVSAESKSLRDVFGTVSAGLPSETVDNCIRLHLVNADQFPILEIYARQNEHGNAIDDDDTLAEVAKRIEINWNTNVL